MLATFFDCFPSHYIYMNIYNIFHHVDSREQTQVLRLGSQHLQLLSIFLGPSLHLIFETQFSLTQGSWLPGLAGQ